MKKLVKDPLIHFLCIGLLLFLVYSLVNDQSTDRDEIIIDSNEINQLVSKWEMQWKRQPTKEELTGLILQDLRQEVYYQEALKMNLDHNDEIIKRRLSQKMEFLSNDLANLSEPSMEELQVYYEKHSEKYMTPYAYGLYQIVLTNDKHENPDAEITSLLNDPKNLSFDVMKTKGDNMPFPYQLSYITGHELSSQLGTQFAKALETVELNTWVGPVASGFGKHIVYVTKRESPTLPKLELVKNEVLRDFQYDKQKEVDKAIFKTLKNNYKVQISVEGSDYDGDFKAYLENQIKE